MLFLRYLFSKGGWVVAFIVAMILIILLAALAIRRISVPPEQTTIENAVRASFPQFCSGSTLHVEPSSFAGDFLVGCDANWDQVGPILSVNPTTCQFTVMSPTPVSELGDTTALNNKLLVCANQ